MKGVNKVTLIGNLGNDPELKYTQDGTAVAKLSLATTETWKDKDGNKQERTDWHRLEVWGKAAEIIDEYAHKGSPMYIDGSIRYGKYTDKDGVERYTTDIRVSDFRFLPDGKQGDRTERSQPQRREPARSAPQRQAPAKREPEPAGFADDFADDDIPF